MDYIFGKGHFTRFGVPVIDYIDFGEVKIVSKAKTPIDIKGFIDGVDFIFRNKLKSNSARAVQTSASRAL